MDLYSGSDNIYLLTEEDLYLFNEGTHFRLYERLGARPVTLGGKKGTHFAVWAPNAEAVSVMGDFNNWSKNSHQLTPQGNSGIWAGFIPEIDIGVRYKYHIISKYNGYRVDKADPFAFYSEVPPKTASMVWDLKYGWHDEEWMKKRKKHNSLDSPISIYEVHLGSWMRVPEQGDRALRYTEMAHKLSEYVSDMGFTHVEFLPVMEHPFYGSWGYQTTGYFAPTSRYGTPQDFMYLIDTLHQYGIGVILDWVPSHFPRDEHGLGFFDGTHLYEHADPRQGLHPDWDSFIFNYGRNEVRSFLISSAFFWLDKYHVDGLRVDAVASMLYLDYGREDGQWVPNQYGGRENIDAVKFLRRFNTEVYRNFPDTQTIAEESTAWPMVSRPVEDGGLGFGMKWDMGWMHDTLEYFSNDPIYRKYHHDKLTFRMIYAFTENFVLPLSHDEVVYGKGSLLKKMPGDDWQKFANLRLLFAYMHAQCGKKLLFMGGEFAQWDEWYHEKSLDWHLLEFPFHEGVRRLVKDLNRLYKTHASLYELDFDGKGFEWIDCNDSAQSTLCLARKGKQGTTDLVIALNFTPVPRYNFRVGVPLGGKWKEILNTDSEAYGGSGQVNSGLKNTEPIPWHGREHSISVTLPPLGAVFFKWEGHYMGVGRVLGKRKSGILLHITSLPGSYGIGDFGPWAYRFAEFLYRSGQSVWQILPLTPSDPAHGNSPYHSFSAFALNPILLSPELLAQWGWIEQDALKSMQMPDKGEVDYEEATAVKRALVDNVFSQIFNQVGQEGYRQFCEENKYWLEDYALFTVIKEELGGKPWTQWPIELRDRHQSALASVLERHQRAIDRIQFTQFLLYRQWTLLKAFCNDKGIRILGDIPIYVVHDSADVWTHPDLFNLDSDKNPLTVAGVPPDYFSSTGQLWGNPVYKWEVLKASRYEWWMQRLRHNLGLFDMVRIDHFRGFIAYWEVPAREENAINGRWVEAPAWDFFETIRKEFGDIPIVAEDLGVITRDVIEVRRHFGFPGMKILLFAFGEDLPTNPYAPHNVDRDSIVYTGTHDNNTARGWFENETDQAQRERLFRYLGRAVSAEDIHIALIRLAMMTVANTSIFPMQDVLGLGEEARMNRPARNERNWQWRVRNKQISNELAKRLRDMTEIYGRAQSERVEK